MTAISFAIQPGEAFAGLPNFVRKDAFEWVRTRRAFWTASAALGLTLLGVMALRIYATLQPNETEIDWSPSANMAGAGWETLVPLFAIFTTMGMLAGERENRTLAWSLSMPLSRVSVLVSKLAVNVAALGLLVIALPLAAAIAATRVTYGGFPDSASIAAPVLHGAAVGLFLVVLNLASSTVFRSQRGVAGIALCSALLVPGLIGSFWSKALPWWPLSIGDWIGGLGRCEPVNWITPVVYCVSLLALLAVALVRFGRDEL
jgi:hypothetical protein